MLPIGQPSASEDAQDSCKKFIKRCRENFARKCPGEKSMEDIFLRWLMLMSDPFISNMRDLPWKKFKWFLSEIVELLIPSSIGIDEESSIYLSTSWIKRLSYTNDSADDYRHRHVNFIEINI